MTEAAVRRADGIAIPREIMAMGGFAAAIFFVVASGAALSSVLPAHASMWLTAGAYGAPAAIAFAAYWWVAQKL
jgi:hypothetical protein